MKWQLQLSAITLLSACALLGCERHVEADATDLDRTIRDTEPVVVEEPRREVDADINVVGPRGNGVRVDVDGDGGPSGVGDGVDVQVDADRPILRRNRDRDDIRVRETPRGVNIDVRD